MRFDVITLFPDLFAPHLAQGITRRAFESGQVDVRLWPLRDFADDTYRRVDDRPYGGGPGMVMLAEPLERALVAVLAGRPAGAAVVHFTPAGRRLDQALVQAFAAGPGATKVWTSV
jgi:tRNA (guanine37-N1)-methyltransferase